MLIEIQESVIPRTIRILIKSIFIISLILSAALAIVYILLGHYIPTGVALIVFILLFCWIKNTRFARIKSINDNHIFLEDGNNVIEINKEDISYVSKFMKFTVTKYFLFSIKMNNVNYNKVKRYVFVNNPKYNLLNLLRDMKITLKNIL